MRVVAWLFSLVLALVLAVGCAQKSATTMPADDAAMTETEQGKAEAQPAAEEAQPAAEEAQPAAEEAQSDEEDEGE